MADAGVSEAAAVEGTKAAGEAAAAEGAMGATAAEAGAGTAAAEAAGGATALGTEAATAGAGDWAAATAGMGEGMGTAEAGMGLGGAAGATGAPAMTATQADLAAGTYGPGMTGAQTGAYDATLGATGSGGLASTASQVAPYFDKALGALGKAAPYASLATSLMAQRRAGDQLAGIKRTAGQAGEVGSQLLSQYQTGQLNQADQQGIVNWKQQQLSQIDQYYQKAGLSNSSMHVAARAQVESQAEGMRQQAVDNLLKNSLSASGVSNQAAIAAANAGVAQNRETSAALQDFMRVLGQMNTPAAPTGTPGG